METGQQVRSVAAGEVKMQTGWWRVVKADLGLKL